MTDAELDRLAAKLMGWTNTPACSTWCDKRGMFAANGCWSPTRNPADNEQLLAKMESEGWLTEMQQGRRSDGSPSEWMVSFWIHPQHGYAEDRSRLRAVVLACLKAKGVPIE